MNKLKYIIFVTFLTSFNFVFSQETNIVDGEIIVLIEKNAEVNQFVKSLNIKYPTIQVKVKEPISKVLNIWLLKFNNSVLSNQDVLDLVREEAYVLISQFNHNNIQMRGDTCPNDTLFASKQWNMKNTGQFGGTIGADISACQAWGLTTSDTTALGDEIVVAVIDNGFYLSHTDLNFFTNTNEIPGNLIDDDGNGYVDDVMGWNSLLDTGNITSKTHGTMVAGVVSAKGNNSIGVSGVNWGIKVLPIQGSSSLESDILKAYGYALDMRIIYDTTNGTKGAFVVVTNSSFGIDSAPSSGYPLWCAFYDSLGAHGILSTAATSNANNNVDVVGDMPTTCVSDYLISVTSTTNTDIKSTAGYGSVSIDVGAPGNITSTYPGNNYFTNNGTSFSTPHVSGAVAFMYAAVCSNFMTSYKTNPSIYALKIKDAILEKGDSLPALLGITAAGTRLNLYKSALFLRTENICSLTNVNSIPNKNIDLTLYPNPNEGNFTLQIENYKKGRYSYVIYSVLGKAIESKEINLVSDNYKVEIKLDTKNTKGLYFLSLKSERGIEKNIKFIIK